MSKTLIESIKQIRTQSDLVATKQLELYAEKNKVSELFKEIEDCFAPKHLLGQELTIILKPDWEISEYPEKIKAEIEKGCVVRHSWHTKNFNDKKIGKKFKVIRIDLRQEDNSLKNNQLVWTLVGVTQKLNDEYGSSLSEVKIFDKVALTD